MEDVVGSPLDGDTMRGQKRENFAHILKTVGRNDIEQAAQAVDGDIARLVESGRRV